MMRRIDIERDTLILKEDFRQISENLVEEKRIK